MNSFNKNNITNLQNIENRIDLKSTLDKIKANHDSIARRVRNPLVWKRNVNKLLKNSVKFLLFILILIEIYLGEFISKL